jgi:hypothetical protein
MVLSHRLLSTFAVLGLVVMTAATGAPAHTASAATLPDVAVKYDGYNYGANGQIDVAFGITNKDAPANNVKLETQCVYHDKSTDKYTRTEYGLITISLSQTQSVPVPKVVACAPAWGLGEYVAEVSMMADVPGGDSNWSNNPAKWNHATSLPKPDLLVGSWGAQGNNLGAVKAYFSVTDSQADAFSVTLKATCFYHLNGSQYVDSASTTNKDLGTISLKKSEVSWQEVDCAGKSGRYVSSVVLSAAVQLPQIDATVNNNTAVWYHQ